MSNNINDNTKLLSDCYKNLDMATWCIDLIDNEIIDSNMLNLIKKQKKFYEKSKCKCLELSNKYNINLKNISIMAKISSFTNIKFTTMLNNSNSNIANKLLQGTSMGIIEIKKAINSYTNIDSDILELASEIYNNESKFYISLQEFL